ncbi:MAG: hypothetical protein ACO1N0_15455 [Fluviicola sp.]
METNWNQLIELYLQNELSEEGRTAFEQELNSNPELREELEMHQLIRSAAKRASQRNMIRQTGQSYLRNLRIKQFTVGIVVTVVVATGIIYWSQNQKEKRKEQSEKAALRRDENSEELVRSAYQINQQSNQAGGESSLIQPTDWQTTGEKDGAKVQTQFTISKRQADPVKKQRVTYTDSVSLPKPTETVLGYAADKPKTELNENNFGDALDARGKNSSPIGHAWELQYDSIGKFNDLYCGYALVMHKSKFGFVDQEGKVFIPLIYDQLVVTTNIKSSKQKHRWQRHNKKKKKVLYIPKRSGKDVKDCDESPKGKVQWEAVPVEK